MIAAILLFAANSPVTIEEYRINAVSNAWKTCVFDYVAAAQSQIEDADTIVEIAMSSCSELRNDYRAAAIRFVPIFLKGEGAVSFSADVVNGLAEETLKGFEDGLRIDARSRVVNGQK